MIYDVRHVTTYEYGSTVTFSHCALRLLPNDAPGQTVLSSELSVDPEPSQIEERICFFGNRVTSLTISAEHQELIVTARTSLEIDRAPAPAPDSTLSFEAVREQAFDTESLDKDSPAHFLHPSRFVPRFQPAADYAKTCFLDGRPVLAGAVELMRRIRADFKYDTKATVVSTPIWEAFEKRRGVCQDFAHIMIAGLRGLGLPAAYVSGYIRTIPPPGKKRLEGADAMHAWVSVWCGGDAGWIDLDPTNSMMIGNDHIVLAKGRDYADISPVAGIILGTSEQDVDVQVDVVPREPAEV
ncbi:transglutaminase family protein [Methylocapsa palsarum]|uniref:Transglutaminase-like enzyme, putative cysteine protease n=1 Tax=Methylocapsa palsarum TaxID=1612308 RepID=A0A1I3XKY1_9HYPH|nr:transglutaminase family protein [Methylocapsa palsarum]SFK19701.1 Transglutaminase-like enzyme, putative cysteine protease [Methylocapsa palsarum]